MWTKNFIIFSCIVTTKTLHKKIGEKVFTFQTDLEDNGKLPGWRKGGRQSIRNTRIYMSTPFVVSLIKGVLRDSRVLSPFIFANFSSGSSSSWSTATCLLAERTRENEESRESFSFSFLSPFGRATEDLFSFTYKSARGEKGRLAQLNSHKVPATPRPTAVCASPAHLPEVLITFRLWEGRDASEG